MLAFCAWPAHELCSAIRICRNETLCRYTIMLMASFTSTIRCVAAMALASLLMPAKAVAQPDFYAGKRLTIIIGLEAGGTVDTLARAFSVYLRKHIPGNPA